jgi:hypothetical protein
MKDHTPSPSTKRRKPRSRNPLEYIAFWQFLSFVMLIGLIWADTELDLSSLLFGEGGHSPNWVGASLLTAGAIIVAFVTIGHTYLQQRKALKDLITICSYCHDVRIENQAWQDVEGFIADKTTTEFTHGICPACHAKLLQEIRSEDAPDLRNQTPNASIAAPHTAITQR